MLFGVYEWIVVTFLSLLLVTLTPDTVINGLLYSFLLLLPIIIPIIIWCVPRPILFSWITIAALLSYRIVVLKQKVNIQAQKCKHIDKCLLVTPWWVGNNFRCVKLKQNLNVQLLPDLNQIVCDYVSDYICIHKGMYVYVKEQNDSVRRIVQQVITSKSTVKVKLSGKLHKGKIYDINSDVFDTLYL